MVVLAGTDFFTVEVLTWRGLVTYYVLFFLHLEARRVTLAGITRHPTETWMAQMARNAVDEPALLFPAPPTLIATLYEIVRDLSFRDGSIEVDVAGQPAAGAAEGARGFIGIGFRLQADGRYEYIYLRPTNGRADDQVPRNHSTQYSSYPDFNFARSRQEAPAKRGSMCMGRDSCLIVNDLKLEPKAGALPQA